MFGITKKIVEIVLPCKISWKYHKKFVQSSKPRDLTIFMSCMGPVHVPQDINFFTLEKTIH